MEDSIRCQVAKRAGYRCEYCHIPEKAEMWPFQLDHIIAQKHRGPTELDNLAWSCPECNAFKGSNIAGIDLMSEDLVRLFHPRKDHWPDHFQWAGAILVGKSDVGAVTIEVLNINSSERCEMRRAYLQVGGWGD